MTYTLEKLVLEEGADSLLPEGYISRNMQALTIFDYETNEVKKNVSLNDVTEGWQVLLFGRSLYDFHRTSKIKEILERTDTSVKFRTQTSVYLLTEQEEEQDGDEA